ncbi:MAG: DNA primase [Candidatus Omnitrophica bacterium]|nr:DNA primase [Candidatus Omnitrophota bacterium]
MIPDAVLSQIQERLDIVEVVSDFVPLRRAGRNFKANCPFHEERTPSFVVNPDKQIFHCFGCGVGGNVFSFLMKFEKKDFREVVEALAEKTGVEIPKDRTENPAAQKRTAQALEANRLALEFYHECLLTKAEAQTARRYLESRGIRRETIEHFKIGYAPESWDALYRALKDRASEETLEKNGLVLPKKGGGFYDRFRGRVIFPILDAKGICVAFGGRVLDQSLPKYLNSPESEIYSKGRNLYGLFQARKSVRENDGAVVVEGYMDLIACHQAGVTGVVASLGTALTEEQARLIRRHTSNVTILYDADKAGEMATLRGLEIFLEQALEVKVVRLPEGHDPDSYLQERGGEALKAELAGAKSLFEFRLSLAKAKHDAGALEGRVKIANEMALLLGKVRGRAEAAAVFTAHRSFRSVGRAGLRAGGGAVDFGPLV